MERTHRTIGLLWRTLPGAVALAGGLFLSACGEQEKDYANNPRPPTPINVSAYISPERVSVSPSSIGAGPIVVVVTNQSRTSQQATFEDEGASSPDSHVQQTTGPINPGDTGELKVLVRRGTYTLRTSSDSIAPATVVVGEERESAQNKVLQP